MRKCSRCKIEITNENRASANGFCRTCHSSYRKEHYQKNKAKYRDTTKKSKIRKKAIIRGIKNKTCFDCGESFEHYVMDFDHLDGSMKTHNVSYLLGRASIHTVLNEIEKCEVVCANCHHYRTYQRLITKFGGKGKRQPAQDIVNQYKSVHCMDCGQKFHPSIMEFDHVTGEKVADVSWLSRNSTQAKLIDEIKKCEVVCANCHRKRTHSRIIPG